MTAGDPFENVEYLPFIKFLEVDIPSWATEADRFICVGVLGDSLVDDGICDGDIALVYITQDVREGDLAAVRTPFGMTLKYVFQDSYDVVRLEGANKKYSPRRFEISEITVEGRVISWQPAERYRVASLP